MNIELLQGELAVSDTPGLSPIDPRFSDIATLVQEAQYEQAAAQAEAILQEEIYDVRIIGYFLYGHFIENGVAAMGEIFQCLADLLGEKLDALGPGKKREKHIQTILNWLMKQLLKKMQYEEEKKSGIWEAWLSDVTSEDVEEALESADALRRALGPVLEDLAGPVLDGLRNVSEWLSAFQRLVYRAPDEEPDAAADVQSEEEMEIEARQETEEPFIETEPSQSTTRQNTGQGVNMQGSPQLEVLLRKLQAFEYLIAEEQFPSAALLAEDIQGVIENFDPREYFPELFSGFYLHLAANIDDLTAFEDAKDTVEWKVMQQLLKVDLDRFVHFERKTADRNDSDEYADRGDDGQYGTDQDDE